MYGHQPLPRRSTGFILRPTRGGLTATWRILAALVALMALLAPADAQTPTPSGTQTPTSDSAQATLSLSAVLSGGAPLTGGLRWRVFGARADPDGSHPLIVESGLAQPTLTIPPGDYVVHVAFGLASAAKRLSLGAGVRSEHLLFRRARSGSKEPWPTRRSTRRSCPWPSTCPRTAIRSASWSTPKPRQAISSDCPKAPTISFRPISTRSALTRRSALRAIPANRLRPSRRRRSHPIRSSTPISRSLPANESTLRSAIAVRH